MFEIGILPGRTTCKIKKLKTFEPTPNKFLQIKHSFVEWVNEGLGERVATQLVLWMKASLPFLIFLYSTNSSYTTVPTTIGQTVRLCRLRQLVSRVSRVSYRLAPLVSPLILALSRALVSPLLLSCSHLLLLCSLLHPLVRYSASFPRSLVVAFSLLLLSLAAPSFVLSPHAWPQSFLPCSLIAYLLLARSLLRSQFGLLARCCPGSFAVRPPPSLARCCCSLSPTLVSCSFLSRSLLASLFPPLLARCVPVASCSSINVALCSISDQSPFVVVTIFYCPCCCLSDPSPSVAAVAAVSGRRYCSLFDPFSSIVVAVSPRS